VKLVTWCLPTFTTSNCSHTSHDVTCRSRCPFSNASIVLTQNQFFPIPSNICMIDNLRIQCFISCTKPIQQDLINCWQFYNPSPFQHQFKLQETGSGIYYLAWPYLFKSANIINFVTFNSSTNSKYSGNPLPCKRVC
jgi:hypothetical protein